MKPPGSETEWHTRMKRAFEMIMFGTKHTNQSSVEEVWIKFLHVNERVGCLQYHQEEQTIRKTACRITWTSK